MIQTVIIEVQHGCAEVLECPEGIEVEIRDYDHDLACDVDADGKIYKVNTFSGQIPFVCAQPIATTP